MTTEEAVDTLRRMAEHGGRKRRRKEFVTLFGIVYADALRDLSINEVADRAGTGMATEIRLGRNLAKYVEIKPDVDLGA